MNTDLRYAIWIAHNKKCVYTGNLILNFSDLEIDHIIPKSLSKKEYVKNGLPKNYNINSLDNLLPTTRKPNSFLKRNTPFEPSAQLFFREIAKKAIPKVKKEQLKFRKLSQKQEKEAIKNYIQKDDNVEFKEKLEVTNRENFFISNHYWNSNKKIALNAHLPSKYEEYGSCVIEFNELETMISLTHNQILELITQKNEKGIVKTIKRGNSYNNTKVFTVIYSNAVHLSNSTFNDLSIILEHFLLVYEENKIRFLNHIQAVNLKKCRDKEGFELIKTNRAIWNKLLKLSYEYDFEKGKSSEYFFNYNGNYLLALDESKSKVRFSIIPTTAENSFSDFKTPDNEVLLIWETPPQIDLKHIENGSIWTAKQTQKWLIQQIHKIENSSKLQKNKMWLKKYLITKSTKAQQWL